MALLEAVSFELSRKQLVFKMCHDNESELTFSPLLRQMYDLFC